MSAAKNASNAAPAAQQPLPRFQLLLAFSYPTVQHHRHEHANGCAERNPFSYVVCCGPNCRSYCDTESNSDTHYHRCFT